MKNIKVDLEQIKFLLLSTFRYVLGRESCAPSYYVDIFDSMYPLLPRNIQLFLIDSMLNELSHELKMEENHPGWIGRECDKQLWSDFYAKLINYKGVHDAS